MPCAVVLDRLPRAHASQTATVEPCSQQICELESVRVAETLETDQSGELAVNNDRIKPEPMFRPVRHDGSDTHGRLLKWSHASEEAHHPRVEPEAGELPDVGRFGPPQAQGRSIS